MATGDFSTRLGKRPSSGRQLGRSGVIEADLSGYAGMRVRDATYYFGTGITDATANTNRIVNGAAIGTPGTVPRALTLMVLAGTSTPRTTMPLPMALTAALTAAAAPTGTHAVTIRAYGTNQFGEPVQEDFAMTAAAGGTGSNVLGVKIFHTISAVTVISESNSSASDTVSLIFSLNTNPTVGLPYRIRSASDVLFVGLFLNLTSIADVLQNGIGGSFPTFSIKEQSMTAVLADAFPSMLMFRIRTSLGMDQGLFTLAGQKFIKNW